MLRAGDQVPDFSVKSLDAVVTYDRIWQRQHLLLVLVDAAHPACVDHLRARMPELTAHDTACVITAERVEGAPYPGVLIADRWGEIWHVRQADSNADLPSADALIEWLRYVQMQCPECQGEAR